MKFSKMVFSPTGGTEKVADALVSEWGAEVEQIDLCNPKMDFAKVELPSDSLALIAVPSFGGRVPGLAAERLKAIKGNGAKAVVVCVYGNRAYDDTLLELEDLATEAGFSVVAAVSAVAEHSILHQYAAGRPDAGDIEQLKGFSRTIMTVVQDGRELACPQVPGNRPYTKEGSAMVPKAGSECTKCGTCAEFCPAEAIPESDPNQTESSKCIGCMRCVSVCPTGARKLNKLIMKVAAAAIKKACSTPKKNELFV